METPPEARLVALETQLAETQRALELLDEVVVEQASRALVLEEEVRSLRRGLAALARSLRESGDEPAD